MHRNAALHNTDTINQISGTEKLQVAIMVEHTIGLASLHRVYARYFSISLQTLLLKPILFQKQWFRVISTGCEAVRPHTVNEFTTNTAPSDVLSLAAFSTIHNFQSIHLGEG